jgi:hypothetical protein
VNSLVGLSVTPSCHAGFRLPGPAGRRSNRARLRLLKLPATTLSRGRDFDAGASNWVAATATPVASPPIEVLPVPAVYAPSRPPRPAIHEIIASASWHARGFAGRPTTSGEPFDPRRLAAASTSVLLGSAVKVEHRAFGKSARQRLQSLCGRSEPRPFTARRAKNRHRPARSSAPDGVTPIKVPRDADRCIR